MDCQAPQQRDVRRHEFFAPSLGRTGIVPGQPFETITRRVDQHVDSLPPSVLIMRFDGRPVAAVPVPFVIVRPPHASLTVAFFQSPGGDSEQWLCKVLPAWRRGHVTDRFPQRFQSLKSADQLKVDIH